MEQDATMLTLVTYVCDPAITNYTKLRVASHAL
jgi:hypothetical protein